ncbi:hypothetical protein BKA70DRAFT_395582 [Coprinopsis sp. MPI-PUGE-AT-0042]|nr:hypothetical protein BKA70DRAFT_395582 [Coprinopsis sp. MPI-PUGE-AT-0042]
MVVLVMLVSVPHLAVCSLPLFPYLALSYALAGMERWRISWAVPSSCCMMLLLLVVVMMMMAIMLWVMLWSWWRRRMAAKRPIPIVRRRRRVHACSYMICRVLILRHCMGCLVFLVWTWPSGFVNQERFLVAISSHERDVEPEGRRPVEREANQQKADNVDGARA